MTKLIPDAAMDQALQWVDDSVALHICSSAPTTYTEATSTYTLGSVAITAGDGNGDFTIADGDTDGRKLTTAAQTVTASGAGTATHIALVTTGDTTLRLVTELAASKVVASGYSVSLSSFDYTIRDAT